ncbi:uncharacterized protein P884DRAFT_327603 [Thermothelomyces heterothallicus CBS 202.75]|uniref:uncharacterized protein n=1 Tax=Thermothelomyces heterothallicus CBS 202.75 TaxID=1149848 RepID=UPI00374296DD
MPLQSRPGAITRRFSLSLRSLHFSSKQASPTQTRPYTQNLSRPLQIYRSSSTDPYLNLSIEHHLLQRSHPDSTILFLYTNRPSVVIGRNQNPWLEVNLHALREGLPSFASPSSPLSSPSSSAPSPPPPPRPPSGTEVKREKGDTADSRNNDATSSSLPISLVRRRSGGGTVFHDAGNTNYSVICPPAAFDRDKHAEMVVRALAAGCGVRGVRVNGRHDIVIDVGGHDDSGGDGAQGGPRTFKVSGSAYKLTRTRSLHHGTCLLRSENLARVSALLRSPAEGFIKARGVESVRSPIRNVGVGRDEFVEAVVAEFRRMYGDGAGEEVVIGEEEALANDEVVKGLRELTSPDWIFGQTPLFTFSTHPTEDDPRERPEWNRALPRGFRARFTVHHGEIRSANVAGLKYADVIDEASQDAILGKALVHQRLHYVEDWRKTLGEASQIPVDVDDVGDFLNHMFGIRTPTSKGGGGPVAQAVVQTISGTAIGKFLLSRAH